MLVVRTRTLYDFVGVEQLACVIIMTIHIIVLIIVVLIIVGKLNFYAISLSLSLSLSLPSAIEIICIKRSLIGPFCDGNSR